MPGDLEISDLTSFDIAFDGSKARLGMLDQAGQPVSLHLPYALISSLVMSLPNIQAKALQAQSGDDSLRLVYPTGGWTLERSAGEGQVILRLNTPDGFEVNFAMADEDILSMACSLSNTAEPITAGCELH
jgi:hypothetical protein